jgi:hypothetical protein
MLALPVSVILLVYLLLRGVVPAMNRIDGDFANYYTAARIVVYQHGDVDRLYDDAWFQSQSRQQGFGPQAVSKFAPFPPATALLLVPLAWLGPLPAQRILTVLSLLALAGSIVLLCRTLAWPAPLAAMFILLSGYAIVGALRLGQPYVLVSWACLLGYRWYRQGRLLPGGASLGIFVPLKYFPVVLLGAPAMRGRWRVLAGAGLAVVLVTLLSVATLGWPIHRQYLHSVLGAHLVAHLSEQSDFSTSFQSFDMLYRQLFVFDAAENPHPWIGAPALAPLATVLTKLAALLAVGVTLWRMRRLAEPRSTALVSSLLGLTAILLAPATATYHWVLLWLPVALLLDVCAREGRCAAVVIIMGCYTLVGFFPYRLTMPFEGHGLGSVLAFPRLALLLVLWLVCMRSAWHTPDARARESRI